MSLKAWTLVGCLLANGYLLGVMVLFATVVYPSFAAVDAKAFPALYSSFTGRIAVSVVPFEFLALLAMLLLYGWRPSAVPLAAVHAVVALGVAYFVITFASHLPSHKALAAGDNGPDALAPLLFSQWARTIVQLVRTAVLAWLAARAATGA